MVFCSAIFLFLFLPVCLVFYFFCPLKLKNVVLLFFSLIFYVWGEVSFLWLIVVSILFNYVVGILIETKNHKTLFLTVGVLINISVLFYYKYAGFVFQSIGLINNYFQNIILPLGISFYTFHSISYLVDIYRNKVLAQKNLIKMSLYIVNFSSVSSWANYSLS